MDRIKKFLGGPYAWLLVCLAGSFFALAYPVYVIRPFRHQGAGELSVALAIIRFRPYWQIAMATLSVFLAVWCWKRSGRTLYRVLASLIAFATIGFGVMSRLNIYEMMFNPLAQPVFVEASKSRLDASEQVISVKLETAARAYPIRVISYHHIVNDVVAGVPIVATY